MQPLKCPPTIINEWFVADLLAPTGVRPGTCKTNDVCKAGEICCPGVYGSVCKTGIDTTQKPGIASF